MAPRKKNTAPKASAAKKTVEEVKPVVETKAEEVVVEVVKEETAPVEEVKPAVTEEKAPAKKAVKKTAAKEAKPATKKEAKAEVATSIFVEYQGDQYNMDKLIEAVKADWVAGGHRLSSIKTINVYIKPEDYTVYYVINDKTHGKVWMQL